MIVKLASVTQHQQMLVLVFLTDATAAGKCDIMCEKRLVIVICSHDLSM